MRYRHYIRGSRKGREANRIEREAMRDPFLADALEGYEQLKDDPTPQINLLRRKIRSRNQRRLDVFKYGGIAASLLFILGFGLYFGFHKNNFPQEAVALQESIEEEQTVEPAMAMPQAARSKISGSKPVIGQEKYLIYIKENIVRPTEKGKPVKGKVTLSFKVDIDGKAYEIEIEQSLGTSADNEAIRLLREGPLWTASDMKTTYTVEF